MFSYVFNYVLILALFAPVGNKYPRVAIIPSELYDASNAGGLMSVKKSYASSMAEALELVRVNGFPVKLTASYVIGGWQKTANNIEEFQPLLEEGLKTSPIAEVELSWIS